MLSRTRRTPAAPASPAKRANSGVGPELSCRAHRAAGQPISYLMHQALAHPELISLAAGFVDQQTLPVELAQEALHVLLSDPRQARAALQYGTTAGHRPLREQLLQRLLEADDCSAAEANLSIDQVVVTAGSNELLHVLADTLLDPGDIVLCGAPTYFVFLGTAANLGVRGVSIEMDEDGLVPEALEEQFARLERSGELPRVKAIYVVSYFDNPSSVTLSPERRAPLVEIAQRWSKHHPIYVIEDAAYRELRYEGPDLPSLRAFDPEGDTVILTETFSKSFSPGIRVGWGFLPPALVEPVLDQKGNIDFGSPNFAQHLMSKVLELGLFDDHLQRLRDSYRVKLNAMLSAADEFFGPLPGVHWLPPRGGLYVWLQLPEQIDAGPDGTLLDAALKEGVLYVPGQYCYAREGMPVCRNMIRLSFGVQSPESICTGMEALSRAVRRVMER
jgi:2-aminoadipate transaminase